MDAGEESCADDREDGHRLGEPVDRGPPLLTEEEEDRRYVVSFAGFFPVDDPEIVALVLVDEPSSSADSGGKAAAPIFADFAKFAARQLRIPSENEKIDPSSSERVVAVTPAQASLLAPSLTELVSEEIAGSIVE